MHVEYDEIFMVKRSVGERERERDRERKREEERKRVEREDVEKTMIRFYVRRR